MSVGKANPMSHRPGTGRRPVSARQNESAVAGDQRQDPCIRAENEDDDGYDPYSDRRPDPEPLFEEDPWR